MIKSDKDLVLDVEIVEYVTVAHIGVHEVGREVTEKLKDGWLLYGHPYVNEPLACQAMVLPRNIK